MASTARSTTRITPKAAIPICSAAGTANGVPRAVVEEDARSRGRLRERGLARHRAHEEDRARAERDRERGDDDDEIAARHAASERPRPRDDGALTNRACAARAQARPSSASAMT